VGVTRIVVLASALAVRSGLRTLLEAGEQVEVVDEAATLGEALPLPKDTDVLVAVADPIGLSQLTESLLDAEPLPVLVLLAAQEADAARILAALHPRAWGLLPLDASAEELAAAVGALREGLFVGLPSLLAPLSASLQQGVRKDVRPVSGEAVEMAVEPLTERELQILHLLAQGLANKQIALRLGISEHTVKFHVSGIYHKLGASNRTEAVRLGARQGLIVL